MLLGQKKIGDHENQTGRELVVNSTSLSHGRWHGWPRAEARKGVEPGVRTPARTPAGVAAAQSVGMGWPIVLVAGMVTGCMGGLMRDVVCNEVPLVLKQGELYVTAALAGAVAAVLCGLVAGDDLSLLACAVATFTLRAGSLLYGWRLPVYRARPPRPGSPKR